MLRAPLCHPPPHRPAQLWCGCSGSTLLFWRFLHLLSLGGNVWHSPDHTTGSRKQNMCVYLCVCVSAKKGDNPAVRHKHRHRSWFSVRLRINPFSPSSGFGGNGGLCAGGALIALSPFWEHGATPPLSGAHTHLYCMPHLPSGKREKINNGDLIKW